MPPHEYCTVLLQPMLTQLHGLSEQEVDLLLVELNTNAIWREMAGFQMLYLDFNPTWTIPPGILRRSVIPGLKKDPEYLDKKGYQLLT